MSTEMVELGHVPECWTRRHLLGLEELSAEEIRTILDQAQVFKDAMASGHKKIPALVGKTCVNLFFREFHPDEDQFFAWRRGDWGPTRSISRPRPAACRKARR